MSQHWFVLPAGTYVEIGGAVCLIKIKTLVQTEAEFLPVLYQFNLSGTREIPSCETCEHKPRSTKCSEHLPTEMMDISAWRRMSEA